MSLQDRHLHMSDLLSLALNPSVLTGVFFAVLAVKFEPAGNSRTLSILICTVFATVIPVGSIFFLKSRRKLTDVEMSIRSERDPVYLSCAAGYGVGAVLLFLAGATWPLWGFLAWHVPNTLILLGFNRWKKVSIHTMVLTSLYCGALMFLGRGSAPLGIVVLIAAWARWDAGNHTLAELILGAAIGGFLTPVELQLLKAAIGAGS